MSSKASLKSDFEGISLVPSRLHGSSLSCQKGHTTVMPALERLSREDPELEVSLSYIVIRGSQRIDKQKRGASCVQP